MTTSNRANKSLHFIYPLIDAGLRKESILNSYLSYNNEFNLDDYKLYLLIKYRSTILESNNYYDNYIKLEDDKYLYSFNVPNHFKNDYISFIKGKYSEYSDNAKHLVCKYIYDNSKKVTNSFIYKTLYKTDDRKKYIENRIGQKLPKDAELYSIVNINDEIYES